MPNKKLSTKKLMPVAEEIVMEVVFCPGSIQALRLEDKIDAFATVVYYCRDIMYVQIPTAATISQQAQDTTMFISNMFGEYHHVLQSVGVTFYFNRKFSERWKLRQVEQSYTIRLQESFGNGFHREYYKEDEKLKLEFKFSPFVSLQEQVEEQSQKTA